MINKILSKENNKETIENTKEYDMDAIANNISQISTDNVTNMAQMIADTAPNLSDLSQAQLEQIAKIVITQRLVKDLNKQANIQGIDYEKERDIFLSCSGKTNSKHTHRAYTAAIQSLEEYAARIKNSVLSLTPAQADDFIYSIRGTKASASVRRDIAACSSFFTFLERRHESIRNPFRGTKARPTKKSVTELHIPSEQEVRTFVDMSQGMVSAAVAVMAYRGLRIGALPSIVITGNRFSAESKGKVVAGELSEDVVAHIKLVGLNAKKPFIGISEEALRLRIDRISRKLLKDGKIHHRYSCHDFRHYYATTLYSETKDIYRTSKALGHTNIAITQGYLKGIGAVE